MTYNQARYIQDTLYGFVMQETTFPVVFTIVDDASTDGEQNVITEWVRDSLDVRDDDTRWQIMPYGRRIVAPHKVKSNLLFVIILLNDNHYKKGGNTSKMQYISDWLNRSEYLAVCEGDDYWTCPHKLQCQIDFLDNNPDYTECSHRFWIKEERCESSEGSLIEYEDHKLLDFKMSCGVLGYEYNIDNYWDHWYSQPLTVVMRNSPYLKSIPIEKYKYYRDVIQHYYSIKNGKGMLLEELMGVYRKTNCGVYAGNKLTDNALITNDNLRTIYKVEGDERVLPVLHNNVIGIWRDSLSQMKIRESFFYLKEHYKLIPRYEVLPFTQLLLAEPFRIIKRKIIGIIKK